MEHPLVIPRRSVAIAVVLLLLLILLAAVVNVPWALTFMRSRTTVNQVPKTIVVGGVTAREWPATTPHDGPWPPPDDWAEGSVFGCRVYDVRTRPTDPNKNGFSMQLQHLGWPLPAIEQKQMWWDWDNPALKGPESDPALSLKLQGLILNPLILGGAAWALLVLPFLALLAMKRWSRRRRHQCMACAYPIGQSAVCSECGSAVVL